MFLSVECFTLSLFFIPSRPAAKHTESKKYGFAAGSGHLNSILVDAPLAAGILINGLLLLADHAIYTGAS